MLGLNQLIEFLNELEVQKTLYHGLRIVDEKGWQKKYDIPDELLDAIKVSLETAYDRGYYDAY